MVDQCPVHAPLVPPERELGIGGRISEEKPRIPRIADLDTFLQDVYIYHKSKGLACILLSKFFNLVTFLFVVFLLVFLLHFVNYQVLLHPLDYPDQQVFVVQLSRIPPISYVILVFMALLFIFLLFLFFWSIAVNFRMHRFYRYQLEITESQLQTIRWGEVLDRIIRLPNLCVVKCMSAEDIVNRIMRRENYLIALVSSNVLRLNGPGILTPAFSQNGLRDSGSRPHDHAWAKSIRHRFRLVGAFGLLFSPLVAVCLFIYLVFRYGEEVRTSPSILSTRCWTPLGRWKLRHLNEVQHYFDERLRASVRPAQIYVEQFPPSYVVIIIARFLSFVLGTLVLVLLVLSVLSGVATFQLWGLSSLVLLSISGAALGVFRALLPSDSSYFEPEMAMKEVAKYTHFFPTSWMGKCHTFEIRDQFTSLYDYKLSIWAREFLGVFMTPLFFLFALPRRADYLVHFFRTNTVKVAGVGNVCSWAAFSEPHDKLSASGKEFVNSKIEQSFLDFYARYPRWKPPEPGKVLLSRLSSLGSSGVTPHSTVECATSMSLKNEASKYDLSDSVKPVDTTEQLMISQPSGSVLGWSMERSLSALDLPRDALFRDPSMLHSLHSQYERQVRSSGCKDITSSHPDPVLELGLDRLLVEGEHVSSPGDNFFVDDDDALDELGDSVGLSVLPSSHPPGRSVQRRYNLASENV